MDIDERIREGEPPLRQRLPRHRISWSGTSFSRTGVPLIFGGLALLTIVLPWILPLNANNGVRAEFTLFGVGFLLAGAGLYFQYHRALREIEIDDECLYVLDDGNWVEIPLVLVEDVTQTRWPRIPRVYVRLKEETRVGSEFMFEPDGPSLSFLPNYPIADIIRNAVADAKSRQFDECDRVAEENCGIRPE